MGFPFSFDNSEPIRMNYTSEQLSFDEALRLVTMWVSGRREFDWMVMVACRRLRAEGFLKN